MLGIEEDICHHSTPMARKETERESPEACMPGSLVNSAVNKRDSVSMKTNTQGCLLTFIRSCTPQDTKCAYTTQTYPIHTCTYNRFKVTLFIKIECLLHLFLNTLNILYSKSQSITEYIYIYNVHD